MVIVCVLKNWLGDVIFAAPAIRVLRSNYPAARIICLAPKRCLDILKHHPCVDEVVLFDERNEQRGWWAKWKFVRRLRALHIDQAYLFHRSLTRAFFMWLGGAKERIGYDTKGRRFLLTKPIPEPKKPMHAVDYNLELVRQAGLRVTADALYEFHFDRADLDRAKQMLNEKGLGLTRLVAIHPGANWPPKRWPAEKFAQLAKMLIERYRVQVIVTGGRDDEAVANKIVSEIKNSEAASFAGKTSLNQLGALFSLCALMISSDSGPLHIAGGVGANVLGIFGPTDPALTGPRGKGKNVVIHHVPAGFQAPWFGKKFPEGGWMEQISVDEVLAAIEREHLL